MNSYKLKQSYTMRIILTIFCLFFSLIIFSQEVRVSEPINMRYEYGYSIIGQIRDNILLFSDKGNSQKISCFDSDLEYQWDKIIQFDDDRIDVHSIVAKDTTFLIFNSYEQDDIHYLSVNEYDDRVNNIDSSIIAELTMDFNSNHFQFELSENEKYSLLYHYTGDNILNLFVVNNHTNLLDWYGEYDFQEIKLNRDLVKTAIDDTGEVLMLFVKNKSRFTQKNVIINLIYMKRDGETIENTVWENQEMYIKDISFFIDNRNDNIATIGLYDKKGGSKSSGYFIFNMSKTNIGNDETFTFQSFEDELFSYYRTSKNIGNTINNLQIKDIIWQHNGGALVLFEVYKELTRRSGYSGSRLSSPYSISGWKDYYYEDIVLLDLLPSGEVNWQNILYKKQFSQDDEGIYSSFFTFKTPSRIRLIYNDEINRSSTVSEYILNGVGQYKRESVFNTEYENLRLRFNAATQISSTSFLVPSERNGDIKIVKISY